MKTCTKCGAEKPIGEFHKDKSRKDGLRGWCKICMTEYTKEHREKNKVKIRKRTKEYYCANRETILKHQKKYQEKNRAKIKEQRSGPASFKVYAPQLGYAEQVSKGPNGELLVACAYCGKEFVPTLSAVICRVGALNGTTSGENRFYDSDSCRQSCPIYRQVLYPKGFKKATSREVVPLLRQLVLKSDNYTCQMCGATNKTAQLHVHHEKSYTLNKIMSNDPDACITLCKACHKRVHKKKGCRYSDLKCPAN